jgi:hypothetical protein
MSFEINDDSVVYGMAVLAIMRKLYEHEQQHGNKDRAAKMAVVQDEFAHGLKEARPDLDIVGRKSRRTAYFLPAGDDAFWTDEKRVIFMVELIATTRAPFAPHDLRFNAPSATEALYEIAERIGMSAAKLDWIRKWYESAEKSHAGGLDWMDIGLFTAAGALVVALTAGLATPFVLAAWGGGMGLTGAAAIVAALATLGGGSVAAGGLGMAGGLWLLAIAPVGAGALGGLGVGALVDAVSTADPATIGREVLKAQTVFKVLYVDGLGETDGTVGDALTQLRQGRDIAQDAKKNALARNESGSEAVKAAEQKIKWFDDAIQWSTKRFNESAKEPFSETVRAV